MGGIWGRRMVWRNGKVVKMFERFGIGKNGDRYDRRSDEF